MNLSPICDIALLAMLVEIRTLFTKPLRLVFANPVGVFWRVGMAVLAMRFCSLELRAILGAYSTSKIHATRDRLQMLWINAGSNAAQMIQLQAFRDWTDKHPIRGAVRPLLDSSIPEQAIAPHVDAASPEPAARIGLHRNLIEKAVKRCKMSFSHVIPPVNRIVRVARALQRSRCLSFSIA